MTNNTFFKPLAAALLLIQLLAGCQSSEKPFPDNTYEWNPATEKPFPDNTSIPNFWPEKTAATENKQPEKQTIPVAQKIPQFTITQPTSFRGLVPCNDCEQIELYLTLRPDQVFFLRKEFKYVPERKQERFQELGGWQLSKDGKNLILKRQNNSKQYMAILNTRQLEVLNAEGKPINPLREYVLTQQENTTQLNDSTELTGLYFEDAGRGYWLECQSGMTWPIARAGDYKQISKNYSAMDKLTDKQTFITHVTAHLVKRQDEESTITEYLVIDQFKKIDNQNDCQ